MKFVKIIFPLALISLFCISFFSCSKDDNPISSSIDTTLDAPRFSWRAYEFYDEGFLDGVWARDTNDIFALNELYSYTARIKDGNKTITKYFPFNPLGLGGFDANTSYLIGGINGDTSLTCKVKKWDGNSFQDYPIANAYGMKISKCYFHKPDEIWIAENNGYINRFNGTSLQRSSFIAQNDSGYVEGFYYDSTSQRLRMSYLVTSLFHGNSNRVFYLYEFDGSVWNKINEFTYTNPEINNFFINGYMMHQIGNNINILNNSKFTPFTSARDFFMGYGGAGYSKNNILVSGFSGQTPYHLFHWNGTKWSKEYSGYPIRQGRFYTINSNFYIAISNAGNPSVITVGIKK